MSYEQYRRLHCGDGSGELFNRPWPPSPTLAKNQSSPRCPLFLIALPLFLLMTAAPLLSAIFRQHPPSAMMRTPHTASTDRQARRPSSLRPLTHRFRSAASHCLRRQFHPSLHLLAQRDGTRHLQQPSRRWLPRLQPRRLVRSERDRSGRSTSGYPTPSASLTTSPPSHQPPTRTTTRTHGRHTPGSFHSPWTARLTWATPVPTPRLSQR